MLKKPVSSTVTNCSLKVGRAYQKFYQYLGKHQTRKAELLSAARMAQSSLQICDFFERGSSMVEEPG